MKTFRRSSSSARAVAPLFVAPLAFAVACAQGNMGDAPPDASADSDPGSSRDVGVGADGDARAPAADTSASADVGDGGPSPTTHFSAVWANDGGDKVTRDELRASHHVENLTGTVLNRVWNGKTINVFGARNEVVSFNLVLEAATQSAKNVTVSFDTLTGPGGSTIHAKKAAAGDVFDWVDRPIELFYTRYLQIKAISYFGMGNGESALPIRFQAKSGTDWASRPDHDKLYPDPLVPLELVPQFDVDAGNNQSIWADIYVPKSAAPGTYVGAVTVKENGATSWTVPVQLVVHGFTLPDEPTTKTWMIASPSDIMRRYVAGSGGYVNWASPEGQHVYRITDNFFKFFHRHKIAITAENECAAAPDNPCPNALPRLNGSLFTAANGYDGPGVNTGVGIYSIGTYGTWGFKDVDEPGMWTHADAWASWFAANSPATEYFLYLADEPSEDQMPQLETWSKWLREDPGPGKDLLSFSTHHPTLARADAPDLAIPVMGSGWGECPGGASGRPCDLTKVTDDTASFYRSTPGYRLYAYNAARVSTGSDETEDDGVALRTIPWAQYKKGVQWWFYWYVDLDSEFDFFAQAETFFTGDGRPSNGNGLMVYPGTDLYTKDPANDYKIDGPIGSLRLKEWRRGIQDTDYLALAAKIDPAAVKAIVDAVMPKALWEYPATDPTWFPSAQSWSANPDDWEAARAKLAAIIDKGAP